MTLSIAIVGKDVDGVSVTGFGAIGVDGVSVTGFGAIGVDGVSVTGFGAIGVVGSIEIPVPVKGD